MKGIGKGVRSFKEGINEATEELKEPVRAEKIHDENSHQ